ncbi:MAG: hypothetical protein KAX24_08250, partial [Anaerolineae bacterium]|nr:hypothetical protein [Anaerolineae bacterium]
MDKGKQESDKVLGHDPFEGMDMEWMEREEGEPSIKVLGRDPFEGVDTEWMDRERDEPSPGLAMSTAEGPVLERVAAGVEPLVQPKPLEPLRTGRPTGVAPARASMPEATFHFP